MRDFGKKNFEEDFGSFLQYRTFPGGDQHPVTFWTQYQDPTTDHLTDLQIYRYP